MPKSSVAPDGSVCELQVDPPFVVPYTTALPTSPDARQVVLVGQEMPFKLPGLGPDGRVCELHVDPPFVVPYTTGELAELYPSAMQVVAAAHTMPSSTAPEPDGTVCELQLVPPFVVAYT